MVLHGQTDTQLLHMFQTLGNAANLLTPEDEEARLQVAEQQAELLSILASYRGHQPA
eukprot:SAG22_NODE_7815_length_705_cov_1.013201_2_plen_56_part_01